MYLTYRELFTIKAICQWCVSSAVIMTVLAVLTAIRAVRYESGHRPDVDSRAERESGPAPSAPAPMITT